MTKDTKVIEHHGEKFEVSAPTDCTLKVSGMGHTAQVSVKGAKYSVRVIGTPDNGQLYNRGDDPIAIACQRIIDFSPEIQEQLCRGLEDAYKRR